MKFTNTSLQYGVIHQLLHWGMAIGFIGMLVMGFYMNDFRKLVGTAEAYSIHKSLGITLLVLVAFRIFWRFMNTLPELPKGMNGPQVFAARAVHLLLYLLMIGMPLCGWLMSNAAGYSVSFWGQMDLPNLVQKNKALAGLLSDAHEIGGLVLAWLIGLHFLAALYHQFIRKDGLLWRMLPCSPKRTVALNLTAEEKKIVEKAPWA